MIETAHAQWKDRQNMR